MRSTASSNSEAVIRTSQIGVLADASPLPWSHYVLLIGRARSSEALAFYHTEALRGGWSVLQLDHQIASQFYERTALSRNKAAMLSGGGQAKPGDALTADDQVRDPLILEFLGGSPAPGFPNHCLGILLPTPSSLGGPGQDKDATALEVAFTICRKAGRR